MVVLDVVVSVVSVDPFVGVASSEPTAPERQPAVRATDPATVLRSERREGWRDM
ncbi:hypothetical protein [Halomicrococcus gelatinilyticus]|uniref:hypothetical protein n=1 Tax=Halomicrococcus gelatinilyticus TaxID=1702103 RepID=UPI002E115AEB